MCPSNDKEDNKTKWELPTDYYKKAEADFLEAIVTMREGIERAKTSRIDVVGQNGNDGDHYDDK